MKGHLVLAALSILSAHASRADKATEIPACATIAKACEAAGFIPGAHKKSGKGLWVDCVGAIAKGKSVAGVTATQAEAQACRDAHKAIRKEKKK